MEEEIKTSYISYVPGPLALRVISRVHQFIFKASRGQIGKRVDGLDILLITTLGHKSGKRQETPMPYFCLLYTSPSPRDRTRSRMPSSA